MNLQSLDFQSLLAPLFAKGLIWATRQTEGKSRGDRDLAKNSALADAAVNVASGLAGSALTNAAAHGVLGHANDLLAKVAGVATTEEGLAGTLGTSSTLPLDADMAQSLAAMLQGSIVKTS